ncbi:C40 family peptidase [Gloeobacter kilaueensis]|uniref:Cell wall-associated hydrolases (Invasion-associated proteins) n=1 Tax=Gloeobacter kilaueensis (strain ATCC BAA-2537 / CCAP 1431/1 / ULC 316 / JS1) TaxID=1183438 RepID=U5QDW9_GLOK1|nr:C40 family peptidase [Gloeobacter kilaueensis]AGY57157.1 cell wall-associated hydrolases (invasion-associated proteins) [Gloeobacter kilaueensis JS1]
MADLITGAQVVTEARRWLGTPFHHRARLLGVGVDCVQLLVAVAHELGLSTYEPPPYSRHPDGRKLRAILAELCEPVGESLELAQPGDVLEVLNSRYPGHVGLATERGILHASLGEGKVIEHPIDAHLQLKICRVYRMPGVTDGSL